MHFTLRLREKIKSHALIALRIHTLVLLYTGDKPTLQQLLAFPGQEKKIKVHEQIGIKYYELGAFLLDDDNGVKVATMARKHSNDADGINKEILSNWLQGLGKQPVTWSILIGVLKDIDLNSLANDIENSGIFSSTTSSQSVDEEDAGHKITTGIYNYVAYILQVDVLSDYSQAHE